jgi:ATP-dependent Zn protease
MAECGMLGLRYHYKEYRSIEYSDGFRRQLEECFATMKEKCYEDAKSFISKNEFLIKKLVPILIKHKTIEKAECEELIEKFGGIIKN